MKIENQTDTRLYWRVFRPDDLVRVSGLADGWIGARSAAAWSDNAFGQVRLEIKNGTTSRYDDVVKTGVDLIVTGTSVHARGRATEMPLSGQPGERREVKPFPPAPGAVRRLLVVNEANIPVHVGISWGNVLQQVRNNLAAGDFDWFSLSEAGDHDLTILPAFSVDEKPSELNSIDHNGKAITGWTIAAAGVALTVATGGAALVFGAGLVVSGAGLVSIAADSKVAPWTTVLTGARGFDVVVTGGVSGTREKPSIALQPFDLETTVPGYYDQLVRTMADPTARIVSIDQQSVGRTMDAYRSGDFIAVTRDRDARIASRHWVLTEVGDGSVWIQQLSNGRYLDAHQDASQDFRACTRGGPGPGNQASRRWRLLPDGDAFRIQQVSSGRILDAHATPSYDYGVVTRENTAQASRRWVVTDVRPAFD
ncbi:RICIN domain-containing protein [Isoptericola sp. 178]|uniref:RICIN domain-containing protein n=1 Tax=Isoptericola sp. 178 TaxID=3064651 RepID=UPI002713AF4D|nr:RICIN domain-containing protein [Isoptericola sp. 178]MDO8143789.1 hypothetical protein [Isoptericola sp. 178]